MSESYVNPDNVQKVRLALQNKTIKGDFYPTVYVIEPTNNCNLSCTICPNNRISKKNQGEIDLTSIIKILEDISPYAEFVMLYWMGEPMLHSNFSHILEIARRSIKGKIVVSTNMTVFDEEIYISMLKNCDIILCSIDKWNKVDYEQVKIGANFEDIKNNTIQLLNLKTKLDIKNVDIIAKGIDFNTNSKEYNEFEIFWKSKGATPHLAWLNDWAGTFENFDKHTRHKIIHNKTIRQNCADLWFKMIINWKGEINICCFDWEYKYIMGTIKQDNWILTTWNSDEIINLRKLHCSSEYDKIDICRNCTSWAEDLEHEAYINFTKESYYIVF